MSWQVQVMICLGLLAATLSAGFLFVKKHRPEKWNELTHRGPHPQHENFDNEMRKHLQSLRNRAG